ncbi:MULTISPECIES: hypothetical protein [Pseudomonas]|uniref:hypothetical protein n=1 Tax=Pseudomonas TaxID=286 RepID=UPI0023D863BC|nr:hypothetical protein [Pseudomonas sp. PSE14]WEJ69915.1 hypothetical protein O6P39_14630 [Pseudomonas sp. PSE14]
MRTQLLCTGDGRCYVQLDQYRVPFADELQAREYLERLHQRLAAPHELPTGNRRESERRHAS